MFIAYVETGAGCVDALRPWVRADRSRRPAPGVVIARQAPLLMALLAALLPAASARAAAIQAGAANVSIRGMTFVQSDGAKAAMVVEAERGRLDPETQVVHLEAVRTHVEGTAERAGLDLTCDEGDLALETHALLATGNVRGRTGDGRTFSTTWVRYDPKREIAFTDAPVDIEDESGSLRGGGFRYYVREGRFRLLGGATVRREN